jgi:hypothetical protein
MTSIMRIFIYLALFGVAFLCGCSSARYVQGQGEAGRFILQQAVAYGGHPVATNGLPKIGTDWQYIRDEFGVGVLLPASEYQSVLDFVRAAFGSPSNSAGWAARDFGVAIMVQKEASNTVVGVYPPMSDEKMGRATQKLTEIIEKNTK